MVCAEHHLAEKEPKKYGVDNSKIRSYLDIILLQQQQQTFISKLSKHIEKQELVET